MDVNLEFCKELPDLVSQVRLKGGAEDPVDISHYDDVNIPLVEKLA